MNLIIFGPPGAGKGTQSEILVNKYNLKKISTGDLFRLEISKKTDLGKSIKKLIDSGKLAPDKITNNLIENILVDKNNENKLIFDGYPRTLNQANALKKLLHKYNQKIILVLYLDVNLGNLTKRITGRTLCTKCDQIFNSYFNPADNPSHKCGTNFLTKRSDDNEETIKLRYETYLKETLPVLDFYENSKCLYKINGEMKIDEISQQIHNIINSING